MNIKSKTMEFYKDIETKFLKADELLNSGEVLRARELLEEILEEEPDYGRAHNHMGVIFMNTLSDYPRAAYHFRLAVKYASKYPAAYHNYALVLLELEKLDKLEAHINASLSIGGVNKAWMYHKLACAKELQKDYESALNYLKLSRENALNDYWYGFIKKEMKRVKSKISWLRKVTLLL